MSWITMYTHYFAHHPSSHTSRGDGWSQEEEEGKGCVDPERLQLHFRVERRLGAAADLGSRGLRGEQKHENPIMEGHHPDQVNLQIRHAYV